MRSSCTAGEVHPSPALLADNVLRLFTSNLQLADNSTRREDEPADQDTGDLPRGVDEDALEDDDLDTDEISQPAN